MPNCDFYALGADVRAVLDFVFEQPGWMLYELASRPGRPLRTFTTTAEVLRAGVTHFQLYCETMGGKVVKARRGRGRTAVVDTEGWGLIQLYLGARRAGRLSACHTNHNSAARARTWARTYPALGAPGAWDFTEVTRISGRLVRFIRGAATAKHGRRPVLPVAHRAWKRGAIELGA